MANVFFTESTGYLNVALIKRLKNKGYQVTALVSNDHAAKIVESFGGDVLFGDVNEPKSYADAIKRADIVVHTPDIYDLKFSKSEGAVVNTILTALKGTSKTFVYTSNAWVLGNTRDVLADEKTPYAPVALVAPLAQYETLVLEAARSGIRTIVVRPATIYGSETGYVEEYIARSRKEHAAYYIESGDNYLSFVHIEDLLDLYVEAIKNAKSGAIFHGATREYIKARDLAEVVAKTFGIKETRAISLLDAQARYGALAEAYALSQQIDFADTKRDLGWEPRQIKLHEYLIEREKTSAVAAR